MIGDGAANEAGYVLVLLSDVVVGLHRLLKCSSHTPMPVVSKRCNNITDVSFIYEAFIILYFEMKKHFLK